MRSKLSVFTVLCALCLAGGTLWAQNLTQPRQSPRASVMQQIGLTQISIDYHRPAVRGRQIYGSLVPYGMSPGAAFGSGNPFPWRAGANDNTTITFSTDVTVEGTKLSAGTYGLHMIPAESGEWTVIFSNDHQSWGSFFYNEANDAARVKVMPEKAAATEWLSYSFENLTNNSAEVVLRWAELMVPIQVQIDLVETVLASFRKELTHIPAFGWQGPLQAANFCARNNVNHEEALVWVDRSIANQRQVNSLNVKATLLKQMGRESESAAIMDEALEFAKNSGTEADINTAGYIFLQNQKIDKAIEIFKMNVKKYPDAWNTYDSLADGYDQKGDTKQAIKYYKIALEKAPAAQKSRIQGILDRLEST